MLFLKEGENPSLPGLELQKNYTSRWGTIGRKAWSILDEHGKEMSPLRRPKIRKQRRRPRLLNLVGNKPRGIQKEKQTSQNRLLLRTIAWKRKKKARREGKKGGGIREVIAVGYRLTNH